jgi:anti-sigma factor ChrR (cupin superfamily)
MRLRKRPDDHAWSQEHLSHYVEGDMSWRARRRLQLHAKECPECSLGIRALRALLRLLNGSSERSVASAPAGIFERVQADAARAETDAGESEEP